MIDYPDGEIEEPLMALSSMLSKSEKVLLKLKTDTSQYALTLKGVKAYSIAIGLLKREMDAGTLEGSGGRNHLNCDLKEALQVIASFTGRVEKILPKFNTGTSQHTLAVRRIKAFGIAFALIRRELEASPG